MTITTWLTTGLLLFATVVVTVRLYRLQQQQPDLRTARRERDALLTEVLILRQQVRDLGAAGGEAKGLADGYRTALDKVNIAVLLAEAKAEIERLRAALVAKEAEVASCLAQAVTPRPAVWPDGRR